MGKPIQIEVPGIGEVGGWISTPAGKPRGALVVVQEIFGVNAHMRDVADSFAHEGFLALAPALFDPVERGVELAYDPASAARGVELRNVVGFDLAVAIVGAAATWMRQQGLRVGVVGYCWGGSVAFLANTRLGLPAVSYYGARSVPFLDEPAKAPMLFHFGELDASIPPADIMLHRQKQPAAAVYVYPARHGFNRDASPDIFDADSARLARQRTLEFLTEALVDNVKR